MRTGQAWVFVCTTWFSRQTTHDCCQPTNSWSCSASYLSSRLQFAERLPAMYAAQVEAPSGGRNWKLLAAALFSSRFSLVSMDLGVFGLHRVDLWVSRQCFGPPPICQSSHDFLRPVDGAGQGAEACGVQGGLNQLRFWAMAAHIPTNRESRTISNCSSISHSLVASTGELFPSRLKL